MLDFEKFYFVKKDGENNILIYNDKNKYTISPSSSLFSNLNFNTDLEEYFELSISFTLTSAKFRYIQNISIFVETLAETIDLIEKIEDMTDKNDDASITDIIIFIKDYIEGKDNYD